MLQLSTLLELCPSAVRRMDRVLGSACPRPGCSGKVEGLKGFKDSLAIREGNFGKGAKGPGAPGDASKTGKSESSAPKSALARAAANEEKWQASVQARAAARGAADEDAVGDVNEEDKEDGADSDHAHGEAPGKVLLGKDGTEFRYKTRKKDHGFLKKVKDQKKVKDNSKVAAAAGSCAEELVQEQEASEARAMDAQEPVQKDCDTLNGGGKEKATAASQIIIIKPQRKEDASDGEMPAEEEEDGATGDRDAQSGLDDASLLPLVCDDSSEDDMFETSRGKDDADSRGGGRAVGGKKKKGKQVLSIQEFFSTPSVDMTPGLSEEEQERLARMEQERNDEVSACDVMTCSCLTRSGLWCVSGSATERVERAAVD